MQDPGSESYQKHQQSPTGVGGANTQSICVFVDDVDAHCATARAAGAVVLREPKTDDHGAEYWSDRTYGARDPEGHHGWFMQRIHTGHST